MKTPIRRFRFLFIPAVLVLAALSLACGDMRPVRVPACDDSADSQACDACCHTNGHNGHVYSSSSTPPCQCMM